MAVPRALGMLIAAAPTASTPLALARDAASRELWLAVGILGIFALHPAGHLTDGSVHAPRTHLLPICALALALRSVRFDLVRNGGLGSDMGARGRIGRPDVSLPRDVATSLKPSSALAAWCQALGSARTAHVTPARARGRRRRSSLVGPSLQWSCADGAP